MPGWLRLEAIDPINPRGNAKKDEFPDLLHPNDIGYAKWVDALQPLLAKFDLKTAKVN